YYLLSICFYFIHLVAFICFLLLCFYFFFFFFSSRRRHTRSYGDWSSDVCSSDLSHYVTDVNAWFLVGDQHDLNFIWDQKPRGGMEEDFDQEVIKRKVVQGYVIGHGEWRGTWGTSGAS